MSHKVPQTSKDAHEQMKPYKPEHWRLIMAKLQELGEASADQIANRLRMKHEKVNRRMSELRAKKLIYRPGNKVATSTGRSAYTWKLVDPDNPPEIVTEKFPEGKSFSEFAKGVAEASIMPHFIQNSFSDTGK
jgi:predicted ArsR family transcriptional regulator